MAWTQGRRNLGQGGVRSLSKNLIQKRTSDQVNGVNNQTDESESGGIEMTKMMMVRVVTTMKMMAGIGMETPFWRHSATYPTLHGHLHINKGGGCIEKSSW